MMHYRRNQNSISEVLLAILILIIGGTIIVAFVVNLRTRRQTTEQRLNFVDVTPVETWNRSEITKLSDIDVQVIQPDSNSELQLDEGEYAPDFSLTSLTDEIIRLSDFIGQPVILNFWASWCGPCRYEMPELVRIYETYRDKGLVILAVNMTYQDDIDAVLAFSEEFALPFPVLLDEDGKVTDELYKILGVPMSFFIRPDGTIATQYIGSMIGEQLDNFVKELLADDAD